MLLIDYFLFQLYFATLFCLATLTIGAPQFFNRQLENEIITPEARKNILPVMMALLTLMGSGKPTAETLSEKPCVALRTASSVQICCN